MDIELPKEAHDLLLNVNSKQTVSSFVDLLLVFNRELSEEIRKTKSPDVSLVIS